MTSQLSQAFGIPLYHEGIDFTGILIQMTNDTERLRGILLPAPPTDVTRCGLSQAGFAQHCATQQWYELSDNGRLIGKPVEFNFYRGGQTNDSPSSTQTKKKELVSV